VFVAGVGSSGAVDVGCGSKTKHGLAGNGRAIFGIGFARGASWPSATDSQDSVRPVGFPCRLFSVFWPLPTAFVPVASARLGLRISLVVQYTTILQINYNYF
jgi:hypothetical protein